MDRKSAKIFKNRLLELRTRLRGDVSQMGFVPDCEMSLRLLTGKEHMLQEIERALESIENGIYGECERCGRRIPRARLTAIPYTAVCAGCAASVPGRPGDNGPFMVEVADEREDAWDLIETARPSVGLSAAPTNRRHQPPRRSLGCGSRTIR
jgi:RNA polymerase-binding transcription factor DksA